MFATSAALCHAHSSMASTLKKSPPSWREGWRPHPSTTEQQRVNALRLFLRFIQTETGNFDAILDATLVRWGRPPLEGEEAGQEMRPQPPTKKETETFRAESLTAFRAIAGGTQTKFEAPPISFWVTKGGASVYYGSNDQLSLWRWVRYQFIAGESWRIAACKRPACGELFIRTGRSEYHDVKCANAARAARYHASLRLKKELTALQRRIAAECPKQRPASAHTKAGGYQHRAKPDGSVLCLSWGTHARKYPRSENQWRFEEIIARTKELGDDHVKQ